MKHILIIATAFYLGAFLLGCSMIHSRNSVKQAAKDILNTPDLSKHLPKK
jgi:hypothetical protein